MMKQCKLKQTRDKVFSFFIIAVSLLVVISANSFGQPLAAGHDKFLGNVYGNSIGANWDSYWNQVTPENSGKWGSVEASRDNYNWGGLDAAYNYAKQRGIPFKMHCLVWGQQQPGWIANLDSAQQAEEVEEWIRLVGERYPDMDYIDVVNEPLPGHAPAGYRNALGGSGATGWDWIVWTFQKARQYMPKTKLILNEYNVINSTTNTNAIVQIANILKQRNLIDGIGIQAHRFEIENASNTTLKSNLDRLGTTGIPVYMTEFDLGNIGDSGTPDDNVQLQLYQRIFPLIWEHPAVKGITIWGYIQGAVWQVTSFLVRSNGTERPALTWLRQYLSTGNIRSHQSGNWNDVNTWEKSDGTNWIFPVAAVPNESDKSITIQSGHTVTVTAPDTADQLIISSGGSLKINSGINFYVKNGDGSDLIANGSVLNSGTIMGLDSADIRFSSSGKYVHAQDGGAIPSAVWMSGSTFETNGLKVTAPSNANQDFDNVVWNNPDQSANLNLGWNGNTINGNITITSTGTGRWDMCSPSSTAEVTINGDIIQTGGEFSGNSTGNTVHVNQSGNLSITGGNFFLSRGTGTTEWMLNSGNVSISNASIQANAGARLIFSGTGTTQSLTLSNVTYGSGGLPIEVENGAVINFGTSVLGGSGNFILKPGSTLQTGNTAGIDGSINITGLKTLSSEAIYSYAGTTGQVTGSTLPDTVSGLIINNSAGLTLSKNVTVSGTLDLKAGSLSLGSSLLKYGVESTLKYSGASAQTTGDVEFPESGGPANLFISNIGGVTLHAPRKIAGTLVVGAKFILGENNFTAATASNTGTTRYVITNGTGSLRLNSGSAEQYYPVGVSTAIAPVWITNSGTADTVSVIVTADNAAAPLGGRVKAKWNISEVTTGGGNYNLKFGWVTTLEDSPFRTDREGSARIFNLADTTEAGSGAYTTQFAVQPYTVSRGGITTLSSFGVGKFGVITGTDDNINLRPSEFSLYQNYPNPFNPVTTISFNVPEQSDVRIYLIDILGNVVEEIVNGNYMQGIHEVRLDASNLASGIYFYRMEAGKYFDVKKLVLMK